ncbi:hypothetical protein HMPREF0554_0080 [Pseudoleptotrichia goodfellowii F0264]|uniref:Uncharacterized protein n=1 Tax=Pseudoleptotrichia goodfellowii F0264 TaxID=596323 RepID=D0GPQ9_9FUSO|nr:hypothetical protein HMPREF0554_0080 [Pseudoleptotrichia goodfellowii F0264]
MVYKKISKFIFLKSKTKVLSNPIFSMSKKIKKNYKKSLTL